MTTPANASDAFKKQIFDLCADYFSIFPVTDTTIADHGNVATAGSIAYQLDAASSAGGGTVILSPGTFNVTSTTLTVPAGVSLIGSGRKCTVIYQQETSSHGITVTGANDTGSRIAHLTVKMHTSAGALTAGLYVTNAYSGTFEDLMFNYGSVNSWAMYFNNGSNWHVRNIRINEIGSTALANGIIITNTVSNANVGDSTFESIYMRLRGAAVGLWMKSDVVGAGTATINDCQFNQMQILGNSQTETGVLGVKAARNTFIQCDFENVLTCLNLDSACNYNTFMNCSDFGVTNLTDAASTNIYINGAGTLFPAEDDL